MFVVMTQTVFSMTPEAWFRHLFKSKAALDGGVVRRKVRDMERIVGRRFFYLGIGRRGFTAVENAGQVVVFCNADTVVATAGSVETLKESFAFKSSSRI